MQTETAVFGGGCFWCTEAIFNRLRGVTGVISGYAGGSMDNPSYEAVSSGTTGHVEVIQVQFDPEQVAYETLVEIFFAFHDPTTLNRQGNDVGEQYRSVIFYTTDAQKDTAETYIKKLTDEHVFTAPIVTTVEPLTKFYPAEAYHKDYYAKNENQPYCQVVISPKIAKLRQKYAAMLKE